MLLSVLMSLRRSRRALPVAALFFGLVSLRGEPDATTGTLPEDYLPALKTILQTALKQSPQTIAMEIDVSLNEARVYDAVAQRLPNVSGDLDYARNQTSISGNSSTQTQNNGLFYRFGVNQPVFHWGALKNQSDAAHIRVSIAEKHYAEAYRLLAVALRRDYLSLVVDKARLRLSRFSLRLAEADLALTKDNFAHGRTPGAEVGGRQLDFDDASLRLERDETRFAGARRAFAREAGLPDLPEAELPDDLPEPAYNATTAAEVLAGVLRGGAKSAFETQIHELEIHVADLEYNVARVRLLPKFNARAEYSLENNTTATAVSVQQQGVAQETVTLNAQWTIFDGFARHGAMLEALAKKRLHERELKNSVDGTLDKAQSLQRELGLDVRALRIALIRRDQAGVGLKQAKEEVERGNLPKSSIDGATANLYRYESENDYARATFLAHWSEFVSLAGTDPVLDNLPAHYARDKP